ncbi:heterokaryon incompatibility protein-domain-containing protein [Apiospora kogelbergensis]|uniref:heterokaryon incompatibility protein-domain-containing protein n=1 Tax=Apiospora kogelbergensis TaxID=1337665 RepID=UPI00312EF6A8
MRSIAEYERGLLDIKKHARRPRPRKPVLGQNERSEIARLLSSTLGILCHVQRGSTLNGLPSWVPDWREPATSRILGKTRPGRSPIYNIQRWVSSDLILDLRTGLRVLKVYGFCLNRIEEVRTDIWLADVYKPDQAPLRLKPDISAFLKNMHGFMMISRGIRARSDPEIRLGDSITAFQDVLKWGTHPSSLTWTNHWLVRQYLDLQTAGLSLKLDDFEPGHPVWHYFMEKPPPDIFRSSSMPTQQFIPPYDDESGPNITAEHMALADKIKQERALFRTSRLGRVGICPEWAQPGDMVCYLRGGPGMYEYFWGAEKIRSFVIV